MVLELVAIATRSGTEGEIDYCYFQRHIFTTRKPKKIKGHLLILVRFYYSVYILEIRKCEKNVKAIQNQQPPQILRIKVKNILET